MDENNYNFYRKRIRQLEAEESRLNEEIERLRKLIKDKEFLIADEVIPSSHPIGVR